MDQGRYAGRKGGVISVSAPAGDYGILFAGDWVNLLLIVCAIFCSLLVSCWA